MSRPPLIVAMILGLIVPVLMLKLSEFLGLSHPSTALLQWVFAGIWVLIVYSWYKGKK